MKTRFEEKDNEVLLTICLNNVRKLFRNDGWVDIKYPDGLEKWTKHPYTFHLHNMPKDSFNYLTMIKFVLETYCEYINGDLNKIIDDIKNQKVKNKINDLPDVSNMRYDEVQKHVKFLLEENEQSSYFNAEYKPYVTPPQKVIASLPLFDIFSKLSFWQCIFVKFHYVKNNIIPEGYYISISFNKKTSEICVSKSECFDPVKFNYYAGKFQDAIIKSYIIKQYGDIKSYPHFFCSTMETAIGIRDRVDYQDLLEKSIAFAMKNH